LTHFGRVALLCNGGHAPGTSIGELGDGVLEGDGVAGPASGSAIEEPAPGFTETA
jgi:hypothetical protein